MKFIKKVAILAVACILLIPINVFAKETLPPSIDVKVMTTTEELTLSPSEKVAIMNEFTKQIYAVYGMKSTYTGDGTETNIQETQVQILEQAKKEKELHDYIERRSQESFSNALTNIIDDIMPFSGTGQFTVNKWCLYTHADFGTELTCTYYATQTQHGIQKDYISSYAVYFKTPMGCFRLDIFPDATIRHYDGGRTIAVSHRARAHYTFHIAELTVYAEF